MKANFRTFGVLIMCASIFVSAFSHAAGKQASTSPDTQPQLTFTTDKARVAAGDTIQLSWLSQNTSVCTANGDWSGELATEGDWQSPPIFSDQKFLINCTTASGNVATKVVVSVDRSLQLSAEDLHVAPTVDLQISTTQVNVNGQVELNWSATEAVECEAGGGWSGSKPLVGSAVIGPITDSTTFSLSCISLGGTTLEIASVEVVREPTASVSLNWQPPTENEDGSSLQGLEGYIIYYGLQSEVYTHNIEANEGNISSYELSLKPGSYYVAMRTVGLNGELSALSNEVLLRCC